jgi:hypothetical protein
MMDIKICKTCGHCTFKIGEDKKRVDSRCHVTSTCGTPLSLVDECPVMSAARRVPAGKHDGNSNANTTGKDAADRYTWRDGIECRKVQRIMAWGSTAEEAPYIYDTVKYVYRYPKKGGSKDIRKAIKCLEELAALVEAHERG